MTMTTLNRAALTPAPTFAEDFASAPACWDEPPRAGRKFRLKYDHSGVLPLSRGLGMNADAKGASGESQIYSNQTYLGGAVGSPFSFSEGVCKITATPLAEAGRAAVEAACPQGYAYPRRPKFRSGMLSTEGALFQQYGYFEIRLRETPCVGSWSAFWLMGAHGCPHQEIDVFERLGGDPDKILCTAHTQLDPYGALLPASKAQSRTFAATARDWRSYGVLWTKELIAWYVDDVELWRIANPGVHQPLMMIADLAMDGAWNQSRGFVADPAASAVLEIDYLRAYQLQL